MTVLKAWTDRIDPATVPVSILSNPTTMTRGDVKTLHGLGADIFTVALDAATPEIFDRTRGKGVQSPHTLGEILGDPGGRARHLRAAEIRRAHHRRHGRDRARRAHPRAAARRHGRAQPHVLLLPGEGLADGPSAGDAARPVAARAARALPDRLPRRARRADGFRRGRPRRRLRSAEGRAGHDHRPGASRSALSGCPGKFREDMSACDRPYGDSPPSNIASYPFQPAAADLRKIRHQLGMEKPGEAYVEGEEIEIERAREPCRCPSASSTPACATGALQIAFDQALIELHRAGRVPDTVRFLRFPPTRAGRPASGDEPRAEARPMPRQRHRRSCGASPAAARSISTKARSAGSWCCRASGCRCRRSATTRGRSARPWRSGCRRPSASTRASGRATTSRSTATSSPAPAASSTATR